MELAQKRVQAEVFSDCKYNRLDVIFPLSFLPESGRLTIRLRFGITLGMLF